MNITVLNLLAYEVQIFTLLRFLKGGQQQPEKYVVIITF